jgi:hypothetical protein
MEHELWPCCAAKEEAAGIGWGVGLDAAAAEGLGVAFLVFAAGFVERAVDGFPHLGRYFAQGYPDVAGGVARAVIFPVRLGVEDRVVAVFAALAVLALQIGAVPVLAKAFFHHVFVPQGGDVVGAVGVVGVFIQGEEIKGAHIGLVVVDGVVYGGEFANQGHLFGGCYPPKGDVTCDNRQDAKDHEGDAGVEPKECPALCLMTGCTHGGLFGAHPNIAEHLLYEAHALALGGGFGSVGVDRAAAGFVEVGHLADDGAGGVEVYHHDFTRFEVVGVKGLGAHRAGDVVPAGVVQRALGAGAAQELQDLLLGGFPHLDLCQARGQDDLAVGVERFGAAG